MLLDLNDGVPVGSHLDIDHFPGLPGEIIRANAIEHQLTVGVLVVDGQQTVPGVVGTQRQREIADVVVVVPKLRLLRLRRLVVDVEVRSTGGHGIAPADQNASVIPFGDVHLFVIAVGQFLEGKRGDRFREGLAAGASNDGAANSRHRSGNRQPLQRGAAGYAGGHQVAHGGHGQGMSGNVVVIVDDLDKIIGGVLCHGTFRCLMWIRPDFSAVL